MSEDVAPTEVSFFEYRPAWWRRNAVFMRVGDKTEIVGRFWWWDRADNFVNRLAALTKPIWGAALSASGSENVLIQQRDKAIAERTAALIRVERVRKRYLEAEKDVDEMLVERLVWRQAIFALRELVKLKDGLHDEAYEAAKPVAWEEARKTLAAVREHSNDFE